MPLDAPIDQPQEVSLHGKRFVLLLNEASLKARVSALAKELNTQYAGQAPILMPVLTGALVFFAELLPQLHFAYKLAPLRLASYGAGMESSGKPTVPSFSLEVKDQHVVVLEDIVDTGRTLTALLGALAEQGAKPYTASLLFKPEAFQGQYMPNWRGFDIPPAFVVGFGLDYNEAGRHLRGIYQLAG